MRRATTPSTPPDGKGRKTSQASLLKQVIVARAVFLLLVLNGVIVGSECQHADFTGHVPLSFDDGVQAEIITKVLLTLAQYHVSASFFEVGSHLAALPDHGHALLAAERAGGHVIGNQM